jgi:hypothetical protein
MRQILVRLPPGEPEWLVRASAVSKGWNLLIKDRAFSVLYRGFHLTPPLLGFFCNDPRGPRFVSTTTTTSFVPATSFLNHDSFVFDCRDGRVLDADMRGWKLKLLVCSPINGEVVRLPPLPLIMYGHCDAAVVCAAGGSLLLSRGIRQHGGFHRHRLRLRIAHRPLERPDLF